MWYYLKWLCYSFPAIMLHYRRGKRREPKMPMASNTIIREYGRHTVFTIRPMTPQVEEEYKEAIAKAPDDPDLRTHYGRALAQIDRLDDAREQLEQALNLGGDKQSVRIYLSDVYKKQGNKSAALEQLRQAVALAAGKQPADARERIHFNQSEAIARWSLSEALMEAGNRDEAIAEITQAIALAKEVPSKQFQVQLEWKLHDYRRAKGEPGYGRQS